MTPSPIQGKTILVTGAGGFIGSHLAEELARQGARVRAFVHYNARGSHGWLDETPVEIKANIDVIAGDIADFHRVREAVDGVDAVLHLAALIGIPYSYHAPASYVSTNINGTLNVLQAARECETPRVMTTSTSETYGTALSVPIGENHPLQAQSPYSATKIAADKLAESYFRSFELPVIIVRPFNTFGPRQSARAVIPTVITQLMAGVKEIRVGALTPTRDMNFVANTVDGMIAAISAPDEALGEVINLGSGREISIGDLIQLIMQVAGWDAEVMSDESRLRPQASEVERLLADAAKAKRLLGWEPRVSLEQGLEHTIEWISEHLDQYRVGEYSV